MRSDFHVFLLGRLLVWAGGAVALVAFPLAMWHATGDARWTAALTAAETAPYLVFGLPAGALADRLPRRAVMGVTGLAAAVPVALVALTGPDSPLTLLAAAVVSSAFFVFADAAGFGLLPELVEREHIAAAVARSTAASTLVTVAGPAVAGALVASAGVRWSLAADAGLVVLGSALLFALPRREAPSSTDVERSPSTSGLIREGLQFVWSHRLVRTLTLVGIGNSLSGGILLGLLVPVVSEQASGASGAVGLAYSALGVGTFLSTLVLPRLSRTVQPGVVTCVGLVGVAAGIAAWAVTPNRMVGLVVLVLYQAAASVVILNGITIRHLATPEHMQARVNTTARMIAWGGQPLGAALAGALVGTLGTRSTLLLGAAVVGVTTVLALTSPLLSEGRRFQDEASP